MKIQSVTVHNFKRFANLTISSIPESARLVVFVQSKRKIERDHQCRMPLVAQRLDERVVAETIAAVHRARAGGYLDDVQAFAIWGGETRGCPTGKS